MYYYFANGFHNTQARVRVRIGHIITARTMRRVRDELCGMSDCTCSSSAASNARTDQIEKCPEDSRIAFYAPIAIPRKYWNQLDELTRDIVEHPCASRNERDAYDGGILIIARELQLLFPPAE